MADDKDQQTRQIKEGALSPESDPSSPPPSAVQVVPLDQSTNGSAPKASTDKGGDGGES